jgi:hypothetical protein
MVDPSLSLALRGESTTLATLGPVGTSGFKHSARARTTRGRKLTLRLWCSKKTKKRMVLGVDIGLEDSVSMALCSLVVRLSYRHLCSTDLAVMIPSQILSWNH